MPSRDLETRSIEARGHSVKLPGWTPRLKTLFRIAGIVAIAWTVSNPYLELLHAQTSQTAESSPTTATETAPPTAAIDFMKAVLPILQKNCFGCHGPDVQESRLRLDQRPLMLRGGVSGEPAVVPGDAGGSYLVKLISGKVPNLRMPYGDDPLPNDQVQLIRQWIDQGAVWPGQPETAALTTNHWSFQPVVRPSVPELADSWVVNPIDAFVLQRLRAAHLEPSPPADRVTLIRRMYLDMLGLPPTPEQVAAFVNDRRDDAIDRLIDDVLSSPHYGERWARHWLDVVRFAESDGFETNHVRESAWYYRDYVIDALNQDKPYDQFIREQLAGDALGADAATGFLVGGPYDIVKSPDPNLTLMQRQDELTDMVNTTGTTFLGLTIGCARCHNHKFDPILQKDFYALQAVFAGVQHGERPLHADDEDKRKRALDQVNASIASLRDRLNRLPLLANSRQTIFLDDRASEPDSNRTGAHQAAKVEHLVAPRGEGDNPPGSSPGYRDDFGSNSRPPNISYGHYSWWDNQDHRDVIAYRPAATGTFQLWLSWGCGFDTHSSDASYFLDDDGDLATRNDQHLLAIVDQRYAADQQSKATSVSSQSPSLPNQAPWSGLLDVGQVNLNPTSAIILRCGDSGSAITADLLVLQAANHGAIGPFPSIRTPVNERYNAEHFAPIDAKYVRFWIGRSNTVQPCIDELEVYGSASEGDQGRVNLAAASRGAIATASGVYQDGAEPIHQLDHVNDGLYGNEHSWISKENTDAWVQIELPAVTTIAEVDWSRDRNQRYSDRLPVDYRIEVAVEPGRWTTIAELQ